jgi:hypothetical protein
MHVTRVFWIWVALIAGCATVLPELPPDGRPAPRLEIGAPVQVLDSAPRWFDATLDDEGRAHMLWVDEQKNAMWAIVDRDGVRLQEKVTGDVAVSSPFSADEDAVPPLLIAVDAKGRPHAVVGNRHFLRDEGQWRELGHVHCDRLVRAGEFIACAFIATGQKVGTEGEWTWGFLPLVGYGGGAILPMPLHIHPAKMVVAFWADGAWSRWSVIDADGPGMAQRWLASPQLQTDRLGNVHVVYSAAVPGRVAEGVGDLHLQYARISPSELPMVGSPAEAPDMDQIPQSITRVDSQEVLWDGKTWGDEMFSSILDYYVQFGPFWLAIDPASGAVRCLALIDEQTPKNALTLSHHQEIRTFRVKGGHMADEFKVGLPFMGWNLGGPRRWESFGLATAAVETSVGLLGMGSPWAPDSVGTFVMMFDATGASRLQSIAPEGYPLALVGAGQGEVIVFRAEPSGKAGTKERTLAQWIKVAGMGTL